MWSGSWRCSRGFLAAWLPARRVRSPGASGYVRVCLSPATSRRGPCDGRRAPGGRAGRGRGGHTRRSYDASLNASFNGAPWSYTDEDEHRNTVSEQPRKSPAIDGGITLRIKCSDSRGRFYRRVPRGATRGYPVSRVRAPSLDLAISFGFARSGRSARPFPLRQSARHPGTRSRRPDTPPPIEEVVRHTRTRLSAHQTQSVST